jgi:hypothetical protein
MTKKKDKEYSVGFRKPPRHTQFKPGQSGNPHGRPKRKNSVADVIQKELHARVAIVNDGKRRTVPMQVAIIKQLLNLAAKGDSKVFGNLMKALKLHQAEGGDNLATLVQEFRAVHEQDMEADRQRRNLSELGKPSADVPEPQGLSVKETNKDA